jgi:hypothetical protein
VRFLVVAVLLVAGIARAQGPHVDDAELAHAKELEAKLEYEQALTLVEKIIVSGHADRAKLVELHFLAGKLAAGLDRVEVAQEHFARVLSLEPGTTLPDGTSPKITMPFDAARGQTAPLRVTLHGHEIAVEADPLQLVTRTEIRDDEAVALDTYGNVVWTEHIAATIEAPPSPAPTHRPLWKTPAFWGGIAVGTAAVAGIGAWRFDAAQTQWNEMKAEGGHDYSELTAVEDRGRRWGLVTNISLGAAILSTVATVVIIF